MSVIVDTEYGRMRLVDHGGGEKRWLLEVPNCGKYELLDDRQLAGELSVNHAAICSCGYHETHPFGPAVTAAMVANVLTRQPPAQDDDGSER